MANLTLTEAQYANDIVDRKKDIDQKIEVLKSRAQQIMDDMTALHGLLQDAASKQAILNTRSQMITDLQAIFAI